MGFRRTLHRMRAITRKIKQFPYEMRKFFYVTSHGFGKAPFPKMIALPLTAQCNYRCDFCEIIGVTRMLKSEQHPYFSNTLSVGHIRVFYDFIQSVRKIDFGGLTALGEPLLSPHFQEVIWEIRHLNPKARILLTSNGSLLTPQLADNLIKAAPLHVTFSIHAASEHIYKNVMAPDYPRVMNNLRYFCQHAQNFDNIKTTFNFGLGKLNYTDAEAIVLLAKELGIHTVYMYPYYKSPNKFMEDVSLYSAPEIANKAMDAAYQMAEKIGQKMAPPYPRYLGQDEKTHIASQGYQGGCQFPFKNFILKSDPFHENKVAFCVCNRIVLFLIDLDQKVRRDDLRWMWNHPVLKALRFPQKRVPEICKFCKDPETPKLRSLHHDEYKARRDKAVWDHLSRFQNDRVSPNHSITLLSENIFSIT